MVIYKIMVELLSPVGDFECLKAAVQNGANSVYCGADIFSARAFATNFDDEALEKVIEYAKTRGVKTNLTLNTLIKNNELESALNLAKKAYKFGIDAIIVQDLGLAMKLIKTFPDLPIHASTQMTVHNLNGALKLQDLGFKRIVLSRELSVNDIDFICKNTDVEIETFIHGALCISYSGQCLFSSMIGGRSGNRGKCAGPCRLPFELLENDKKINSGYLLSTRDLCGLDYIPKLIESGVKCFKIEGRMKNPEYVATVTRIYRKYIDLAYSNEEYIIDENDRKELLQVFNRGMSSSGHLSNSGNKDLVYKEKPNNMGLYLGKIQKYNEKKGLITIKLNEPIKIGDTISVDYEQGSYTVSELMNCNNKNITETNVGDTVIIGRMKGNIKLGNNVYKMSSKELSDLAKSSYSKEYRKVALNCNISIKEGKPIVVSVSSASNIELYKDLFINYVSDLIPLEAKNRPLSEETIISQFSKTASTPFEFKHFNIDLDNGLFIPKLSLLNDLRRKVLALVEDYALQKIKRNDSIENNLISDHQYEDIKDSLNSNANSKNFDISLLLNILNINYDYSKLSDKIKNVYIPLKYFTNRNFADILHILDSKFNIYIYMPTIIKSNYKNLLLSNIESTLQNYKIQGFVISNICNFKLLESLSKEFNKNFEIITNYTFNVYNNYTISELKELGAIRYTISPELDKTTINSLSNCTSLDNELIVYGKTPVLNMNYCLLGETDKCYPTCKQKCNSKNSYLLKDRLNMTFQISPDNIQTVTTIYNSKITSISPSDFNINFARIDILNENIDEINNIVLKVKNGERLEGKNYTNGNLNREI
ncbi:MAG: U32 family peptidase [Clostridium sp.]|nr:U32 family peptidase [Clostridium sp.]